MDPNHGLRAAELIREMHGELFSITEEQLDTLCYTCEFHNHGMTSDDLTIGTCWDADRLDLPRVGIRPEPKYMSTDEGRRRTIV